MLIKAGVDISRLKKEIRSTLNPLADFALGCNEELVITSTYDGNHQAGSLHYADLAVDVRKPKTATHDQVEALTRLLGSSYDVISYTKILHIEYDPKTGPGKSLNWRV